MDTRQQIGGPPAVPASWFTILVVFVVELIIAAVIAGAVAQAYIAYECGHADYEEEHAQQCSGGLPYPLS